MTVSDWAQVGRFTTGLDIVNSGSEFQRADCAPASTRGDGVLSIADWAQAGRFAAGLDPVLPAGGPTGEPSAPQVMLSAMGKSNITRESQAPSTIVHLMTKDFSEKGVSREIGIEVDAQGNENAFGLSLEFDPSRWGFISARASDELSIATLQVNRREAESGRVGLALALPAGRSVGPGRHQLFFVTFRALSSEQKNDALITLGDKPVAREVVDVNANVLKTRFEEPAMGLDSSGMSLEGDPGLSIVEHYLTFFSHPKGLEYWISQNATGLSRGASPLPLLTRSFVNLSWMPRACPVEPHPCRY